MTCKDCIHNEFCSGCGFYADDDTADRCKYFKDKSKFIELPSKVGDKYYTLSFMCDEGGYYKKPIVSHRISDCENCGVILPCKKQYHINEYEFESVGQIFNMIKYIGSYYFLTKEEAEAKLKELQKCK